MVQVPVVALAGNPNAGKTSIFNSLTGLNQHVGNWPGKTVARKNGTFKHHGQSINLVDLPGTYSLSSYSEEEIITRNFIVKDKPDAVVVVIDAANLERNLYLAAQILETGAPVIIALNMMDQAEKRHIKIDVAKFSAELGGVPVIPTVASRSTGMDALKDAILNIIPLPA